MAKAGSRPGATSKKKGPTKGTGGHGRKALEGRGNTPKAEDRVYHKAYKMKKAAENRKATNTLRSRQPRLGGKRASDELVTGRNSVLEALQTEIPAKTLFVMSRIEVDDRVRDIMTEANKQGLPMLEIGRNELDRLTDHAVHQGVALQIPPYKYPDAGNLVLDTMDLWYDKKMDTPPLFVALDGITDPRNLGAIIRSVSAFSGNGVIIPERRSAAMTASAWKTSSGAAARIPVAKATNLTRVIQQAKDAGIFVVGLDGGGDVDLPNLELASEPLMIVVGSEGKGLSRLVTENCDQIVSIPISSAMESLNASMAVGIALYEVSRRRAA
ncbi:23S rRNA (guanosine(2251)-2'-O)-methyltransferase RlmB [Rothia nasimurium]|uniref:23S rRNA (guanosine(2251)-2'-O)-methyltransferase RlmB n=1 Tax=Rothia nasimurium TaxID=85336 RepID=UPI001F01FA5D|nr:23S rRNA (guanosine(2251)-2'-O)-methyltransferase RlmB [Rothia nasimurium]